MSQDLAEIKSLVDSLPTNDKIALVDMILENLSPSDVKIEELWKIEVERRMDELESGEMTLVPGEQVFAKIRNRFR